MRRNCHLQGQSNNSQQPRQRCQKTLPGTGGRSTICTDFFQKYRKPLRLTPVAENTVMCRGCAIPSLQSPAIDGEGQPPPSKRMHLTEDRHDGRSRLLPRTCKMARKKKLNTIYIYIYIHCICTQLDCSSHAALPAPDRAKNARVL